MPPIKPVPPEILDQLGIIIGGVIGLLATIFAAVRGRRRTPAEVGTLAPAPDRVEYILAEQRAMAKAATDRHAEIVERLDDQDDRLNRIYTDTQVIRDRGR